MRLGERVDVIRRGRSEVALSRSSREALEAEQARRLAGLLDTARASSPFHRERLGGAGPLGIAELPQLPVMHKRDLIDSFEEIATDRRLTGAALEQHMRGIAAGDPLLFGEYRVMNTGGTSGTSTYVPFDRSSWHSVLAPYVSLALSAGFGPRVFPRWRTASVTAGGPLHMTNRMATSNRSPIYPTLRLDVTTPISQLADALERFRPHVLTGYPSVIAALAEEQATGRMRIEPRWVLCGSEQLLARDRAAIRDAWCEPLDVYATTETGGVLASECPAHEGLHLREETCIVEAVDARERPVADGEPAAGLLVTSWVNQTVPIVRYLIDDPVTIVSEPCACGRSTRRIVSLTGRQEDTIRLSGADGAIVAVHPNHFEETIEERSEVARYQVVHCAEAITVSVVSREGYGSEWTHELAGTLASRLRELGAQPPPVQVELVDELTRPANAGAKLKVVRSEV
jgi:phenylacetate-CoA ligase